jgi:hypothetical protein
MEETTASEAPLVARASLARTSVGVLVLFLHFVVHGTPKLFEVETELRPSAWRAGS